MPTPLETPGLYDVTVIAGVSSPGIARVEGADLKCGWKTEKGQGQSGAGVKYEGEELAEFSVTYTLWRPEHFAAWPAYQALLESCKPEKGRKAQGLDFRHPRSDPNRIRSVVIKTIGQMTPRGDGAETIKVEFQQYREPTAVAGKPSGSKSGEAGGASGADGEQFGPPTAQQTAEDEREALIEELTAQAEALA